MEEDMKKFSNLQHKVNALMKSKRCSQEQAKQLKKYLRGLKHSLDIGNSKQAKIHIESILEIIIELLEF